MTRSRWVTLLVLLAIAAGIVVALLREAATGPTFRAEDHAGYDDCLRAIPVEWRPGSLERMGAESACLYVHRPHRP
jgi:hypothetical protein